MPSASSTPLDGSRRELSSNFGQASANFFSSRSFLPSRKRPSAIAVPPCADAAVANPHEAGDVQRAAEPHLVSPARRPLVDALGVDGLQGLDGHRKRQPAGRGDELAAVQDSLGPGLDWLADLIAVHDQHVCAAAGQLARDGETGEACPADEDVPVVLQGGTIGTPLGGSSGHGGC